MTVFSIVIDPALVEICEGDPCAAAILALFARWAKAKRDGWIYKKQHELQADLMGMFGKNKVAEALKKLAEDWGYLRRRNNPFNGQDRTYQYQYDRHTVEEVLNLLNGELNVPNRELDDPNRPLQTPLEGMGSPGEGLDSSTKQTGIKQTDKKRTQPPSWAAAQAVGAVANFGIPDGDIPEMNPETPEARPSMDEHEAYNRERENPPPSSAPPPSPAEGKLPTEITRFFDMDEELRALVTALGAERVKGVIAQAKVKTGLENPPGWARVRLRELAAAGTDDATEPDEPVTEEDERVPADMGKWGTLADSELEWIVSDECVWGAFQKNVARDLLAQRQASPA